MNSNLIILESFIFSSFQINKLGLPRFFDINSYVIRQPYPFSTSFVRFSFTCEQIISTIKFLQKKIDEKIFKNNLPESKVRIKSITTFGLCSCFWIFRFFLFFRSSCSFLLFLNIIIGWAIRIAWWWWGAWGRWAKSYDWI